MVEPLDEAMSPEYLEVIFRTGRLGYYQNYSHLLLKPDDLIIVEVDRGEDIAQIIHLVSAMKKYWSKYLKLLTH